MAEDEKPLDPPEGEGGFDAVDRNEIGEILQQMRAEVRDHVGQLQGVLDRIDGAIERLNFDWQSLVTLDYRSVKDGDIPYDLALRLLHERPQRVTEKPPAKAGPTNADVIMRLIMEQGPLTLKEIRKHLEAIDHRLVHAANPAKAIFNEMASMRARGYVDREEDGRFKMSPRAWLRVKEYLESVDDRSEESK